MKFRWDETAATAEAHNAVALSEAASAFGDHDAIWEPDETRPGCGRLIGRSPESRELLVVHVVVPEPTIQVLGARRATAQEERRYEAAQRGAARRA